MKIVIIAVTLFLAMASASAQTAKEWRDSLSYLSQLIERHPKDLELRMRKAEANIALEQWQYAHDEYSNILELYPTHLGALYFRAYVNDKLKRFAFARQDYEQVLKYEPDHEGALTGIVRVSISEKKLTKAYDEANHLIELYKENPRNYLLRSEVEEALGLYSLAIDDVTTAIDMEKEKSAPNQRISLDDDLTRYVLMRIDLYKKQMAKLKKKSDRELKTFIENDENFLISKGIPSRIFRK